MNLEKTSLIAGALFGITGVILGAFGAHILKRTLSPEAMESYRTGVSYQLFHALFLLVIGMLAARGYEMKVPALLCIAGILLFSGSIYLLTVFSLKQIALLTPAGGLLLILSWIFFLIRILNKTNLQT